jgi:hypothetical protein
VDRQFLGLEVQVGRPGPDGVLDERVHQAHDRRRVAALVLERTGERGEPLLDERQQAPARARPVGPLEQARDGPPARTTSIEAARALDSSIATTSTWVGHDEDPGRAGGTGRTCGA